ncbi:MAG: SIS domain-containing protein [Desulfamplus sp.]|nr:SIS domain-containing protein [Desulfamplus sp.]
MCGVVCYLGSDPDVIARIVTGMSAIIYRAPDSTGIGTFGNMSEPMVMRKCLGSVANMIPVLMEMPCHGGTDFFLKELLQDSSNIPLEEMQKKLIRFENLRTDIADAVSEGSISRPTHYDIFTKEGRNSNLLVPGFPGRPGPLPEISIRSRNDFRRLIETLLLNHNCSPVAIKSLLRQELEKRVQRLMVSSSKSSPESRPSSTVPRADIYNAFDFLFLKTFEELRPVKEMRRDLTRVYLNPHAKKILWKVISSMTIKIPDDFDNDAVSFLFRAIDASIISAVPYTPGLISSIQAVFDEYPLQKNGRKKMDWFTLYRAEHSLNLYGMAAAAALEWFCINRLTPDCKGFTPMTPDCRGFTPMTPDCKGLSPITPDLKGLKNSGTLSRGFLPRLIDYMSRPVIAHGRWALQSSVTVTNAHPFTDSEGKRSIVLNGQFSGDVEDEMRRFLSHVAGYSFMSENSAEYMALFWGYYHESMLLEKKRFQEVKQQVEMGLEIYGSGNNTVNYRILNRLKDKTVEEIDALAFITAARLFTRKGGQIAVAGISMASPGTLFAAASNRPLFLVKRPDKEAYMAVSDINAALGLFSQREILKVTREYDALVARRDRKLSELGISENWKSEWDALIKEFGSNVEKVLSKLQVIMYTLEGRDLFARIETGLPGDDFCPRILTITDFDGNVVHDIVPERISLTPPHVHKDINSSFFESHMKQIPDLLNEICNAVFEGKDVITPIHINKRLLVRKFGNKLGGLKRIILTGMGTSHHTCLFAAPLLRKLMPGIQVICIKPVELIHLPRQIFPDQDIVLMLSWSATTAEMVDCAKKLHAMGAVCVGITEKTVGDLALVTRKSGGTVHAMSGEEVTVPAVKSTFCMLMTTQVFALWFKWNLLGEHEGHALSAEMRQIPQVIRNLLGDHALKSRLETLAFDLAARESILIVDDLTGTGTGLEAALKIEEMTWFFKGRCVDYLELPLGLIKSMDSNNLIIVNATSRSRRFHALGAMLHLHQAGIHFIAVAFGDGDMEEINHLTDEVIRLPRLADCFQPFADLVLYYWFAFFSGRARGRIDDDYPRNRAKSVTTSRSAPAFEFAPRSELFNIAHRESLFPQSLPESLPLPLNEKSIWETRNFLPETISFFRHLRQIARALESRDPLSMVIKGPFHHLETIAKILFDPEGEGDAGIFFHTRDSVSLGAVEQVIIGLGRFFPCTMRWVQRGENMQGLPPGSLNIFVSSAIDGEYPPSWFERDDLKKVWFLPGSASSLQDFMPGFQYHFAREFKYVDHCLIYSSLMLFLLGIWSFKDTWDQGIGNKDTWDQGIRNKDNGDQGTVNKDSWDQGTVNKDNGDQGTVNKDTWDQGIRNKDNGDQGTVNKDNGDQGTVNKDNGDAYLVLKHFRRSSDVIANMLGHEGFLENIEDSVRSNLDYSSLIYLCPPNGSGRSFVSHFDRKGGSFARWESFGSSAHGPLVTVDSDVESKFVALESRRAMVKRYGEEQVSEWETRYLRGVPVDRFQGTIPDDNPHITDAPFFYEEGWYLPVLKPDYDTSQDNLVILDAGDELFFNQAIDDLTVFGCRHARMILISQEYFLNNPEKKALQAFPLSGVILVPSMEGEDRPVPLSDSHLPFANALIGAVISDIMAH